MLYLAADGGGTKLLVLLYDDSLRLLSVGEAGGTNFRFRREEDVRRDIRLALHACLGDTHPVLAGVGCTIVGAPEMFLDAVGEFAHAEVMTRLNEGLMGLLAGCGEQYGMLALSGTGSDVFCIQPDGTDFIGGWGSVLGDEGSGYDLGRKVLQAAIWCADGRGPETALLKLVMERWQLPKLWSMVEKVCDAPDQRRLVASASRLASEAAHAGDAVALSLYEEAGQQLALLANTMLRHRAEPLRGHVCVGGGTWKGHPVMLETFRKLVTAQHPELAVETPAFEPVMGAVIRQAYELGWTKERLWPVLRERFARFTYQ